jgi:hypothetical protein
VGLDGRFRVALGWRGVGRAAGRHGSGQPSCKATKCATMFSTRIVIMYQLARGACDEIQGRYGCVGLDGVALGSL